MEIQLEHTSYDAVPYQSHPYPQSHADRLAVLGRLFGISSRPVWQCRVLELGCAGGGNLVPMAYHLPASEFVGVDLSRRHVEAGQQIIRNLGLGNVRIEHAGIMDVAPSWGHFDYVIAHGVYSWVSNEVQERILGICAANLAEDGIAYVSYNTYPGWHMREMIRHMMLYHAGQFSEHGKRLEQARALMDFLTGSIPAVDNYYGMLLKNELDLIKRSQDWYLFHDHLEEINSPIYFYQFMERADQHGLQYLAEADFSTMLTSGFSAEVADTLSRISQNIIQTEQYMDFLRNRHFRQTLLCRKGHQLKRDLDGTSIDGLLVASAARPASPSVDLGPEIKQAFQTPTGARAETAHPMTKAALMVLGEQWPKAIDQETLMKEAGRLVMENQNWRETDSTQSKRVAAEDMLHCYAGNVVEFHTWQADFICHVSKKPTVSRLAGYQAVKGLPVVNQRHELVNLDPVSRELVKIMDGTCDLDALLACLIDRAAEGALLLEEDGHRLTDSSRVREALQTAMDGLLPKLAKSAMLIESRDE